MWPWERDWTRPGTTAGARIRPALAHGYKPDPHVAVSKQNKLPFSTQNKHTHTVKHPGSYFCSTQLTETANGMLVWFPSLAIIKLFKNLFEKPNIRYLSGRHIRRHFSVQTEHNAARQLNGRYCGRISLHKPIEWSQCSAPLCILFTVPPGVLHSSTPLHRSYFLPLCTFSSIHPLSEKRAGDRASSRVTWTFLVRESFVSSTQQQLSLTNNERAVDDSQTMWNI